MPPHSAKLKAAVAVQAPSVLAGKPAGPRDAGRVAVWTALSQVPESKYVRQIFTCRLIALELDPTPLSSKMKSSRVAFDSKPAVKNLPPSVLKGNARNNLFELLVCAH